MHKTLMNQTINSIKNTHSPHSFLSSSTMQSPPYSRARMNAILAHQKSMPALSSQSKPPSPPRKSATDPDTRRSHMLELGPPPQYPPPAPPSFTSRMIKTPGGGQISVQVRPTTRQWLGTLFTLPIGSYGAHLDKDVLEPSPHLP